MNLIKVLRLVAGLVPEGETREAIETAIGVLENVRKLLDVLIEIIGDPDAPPDPDAPALLNRHETVQQARALVGSLRKDLHL